MTDKPKPNKVMDDFFTAVQYDEPAEDWRKTPATFVDPDEDTPEEGGLRQQAKKALMKHLGPGPHPNGTEQSVHGGGADAYPAVLPEVEDLESLGFRVGIDQPLTDEDQTALQDAVYEVHREMKELTEYLPGLIEGVLGAGVKLNFNGVNTGSKAHYVNPIKTVFFHSNYGEALAHELAHWFDAHVVSAQGERETYASSRPGSAIAALVKRTLEVSAGTWDKALGNMAGVTAKEYLTRPTEVFARMVEQYLYYESEIHQEWVQENFSAFNRYHNTTESMMFWLPRETFKTEIAPLVKAMLGNKVEKGFDPSQPRQPKGSPKGGEFMSVGEPTDADLKTWRDAHVALTGVSQQYKNFVKNMFEDLNPDNQSSVKFLALREGKQVQGLLGYSFDHARAGELGIEESGMYLSVQYMAVAPWNHPSQPNRKKGYGTKIFMQAVKKLLAQPKLKGLVLSSLDGESDKFYDALGLRSNRRPGLLATTYTLDRYEAKDLYDAYQARLRRR